MEGIYIAWRHGNRVGTVGADASGKASVEEQLSGGAELGNVAKLAPVDGQVAGRCGLRVAEGRGYSPSELRKTWQSSAIPVTSSLRAPGHSSTA
jgi:hypothetical protein